MCEDKWTDEIDPDSFDSIWRENILLLIWLCIFFCYQIVGVYIYYIKKNIYDHSQNDILNNHYVTKSLLQTNSRTVLHVYVDVTLYANLDEPAKNKQRSKKNNQVIRTDPPHTKTRKKIITSTSNTCIIFIRLRRWFWHPSLSSKYDFHKYERGFLSTTAQNRAMRTIPPIIIIIILFRFVRIGRRSQTDTYKKG